jgi:ribose/xylose/arabinose/galactoside ABC-type transport system permease subunit
MAEATTERKARFLNGTRSVAVRVATAAGGRGGAVAILLLLVLAFFIATPNFLTADNTLNVLRQYSVPAILAVGQTLVIVSAGIDLSVASTAALSGSLMGVAFAHWGWPEPLAVLLGLAAGFAVGAFNGFVISRLRVPDFIATLGTLAAVRGVALLVTDGLPVPDYTRAVEGRRIPGSISTLGADSVLGIPLIVVVAAVCAVVGWFLLTRTNLFGGEGGIGGTMIGILIIGVLANGLNILGVAEFWQRVVNGLIIVAVVALDQWRRRVALGSGGLKSEAKPSGSPPVKRGRAQ